MIKVNDSPIQPLEHPILARYQVQVDIKRDDLLHPIISGNKWRKLKHILAHVETNNYQSLISMGGNWSNHLHALAFLGKEAGLETVAYVRAHPEQSLTATLQDCIDWGMRLNYINRKDYAKLRQHKQSDYWSAEYANSYWLSEGGFSQLAIKGIADIGQEVKQNYDKVIVACGSGASLLGVSQAFPASDVIGIAAFKGAEYLTAQLEATEKELALNIYNNWHLATAYHCGGFGKVNQQLKQVIAEFEQYNEIVFEPIYNGKVLLALTDMLKAGVVTQGEKILLIHTGGLQGVRSGK